MAEYLAPGVYVEEVTFRAPSIEGVGTSTAGFAGVTLTGPTGSTPQLLTSFGDFQNIYGGYEQLSLGTSGQKTTNYLAMSVKAFFDNGGSRLYVSRVFVPNSSSDLGFAASAPATHNNVVVSARFPGAAGKQTVSVRLRAAKVRTVDSLPQGSLVAYAASNTASLAADVTASATTVQLSAALPGGAPAFVAIDSETLGVSSADSTRMILTVTRGALGSTAASHAAGSAVLLPVAFLQTSANTTDTTVTLSGSAPVTTTTPAPTTTATPTTTLVPTTTTPAPTTTAAPKAFALSGGTPPLLLIGSESMSVASVDSTGAVVTVARAAIGTTAASHSAGAPVFAPIVSYANGEGSSFTSTGTGSLPLPSPLPAGFYALTMAVTANSAAGTPVVFDGLGFDRRYPNYLGTTLAATPPRHIDALQNQIAFEIGSNLNSASALFSEIFPTWGGPGSAGVRTYELKNGNDGNEPDAPDYDAALALFTALEDIAIVAAPGSGAFAESQDIINSLITHVSQQRAYRVAILETPPDQIASDNENVRALIDSSYAALYAPWVITPNPLAKSGSSIPAEIAVPPTGFVAGIYARNDQEHGVAKAPGNEVILGASRLERDITFAEQGVLNPLGINCLRYFPYRGFRLWGARTASSDSEFKYVNVRRYFLFLEHSIDNSTQWAVFENNGPALWSRVKEAIDSFLFNEFREGNLLGDTPAQAYFVRCDRTTMTQNDLDNGRMICLIGVSVLKPAEFVVFRIGQTTVTAQA